MIVYQYDHAGIFLHETEADPSPLEPGKYLIPARCTTVAPPDEIPDGQIPRWNGAAWDLIPIPQRAQTSAVEKLHAFLSANPDVADLIERGTNE